MKRPDEVVREFVRQCLRKADEEPAMARYSVIDRIELGFAIGFHAHQAEEKYLKAVLVWHQVEFTKTHDIDRLLALVETVDAKLSGSVRGVSALSL
jgi:HEPN domain-containing protein